MRGEIYVVKEQKDPLYLVGAQHTSPLQPKMDLCSGAVAAAFGRRNIVMSLRNVDNLYKTIDKKSYISYNRDIFIPMIMLHIFIHQQRTKCKLTQEYMASQLKMSRPTYMQIERGERELTVTEAQKLAAIFEMTLENFLNSEVSHVAIPVMPPRKNAKSKKRDMRINTPQQNLEKFREILLYILQKIGAKPNVGETVIYKILYFIDFDFYEKFEEQLMGLKYMKNHHGPSPVGFARMVATMEKEKDLEKVKSKYFQYEQKKYIPLREPDLSQIDAKELQHIDAELARLSDMNATQIREYSHEDIPWKVHKMGEVLEYEYVFYREPPYAMRSYDDDPL